MCAFAARSGSSLSRRLVIALALLALLSTQSGCEPRHENPDHASPIVHQDSEYVLAILLDLSGSFTELMTKDGKAYRFAMRVADKYLRRMDSNDRLIISQLSATNKALLWDGSPIALRRSFPSANAFRDFLLSKSDPNGSRIHDGIADTLDYLLALPGVQSGKTKSALFVLSDMIDNAPEPEKSKERLLQALAAYGRAGGGVAFLWVDSSLVLPWRTHLKDAGIAHFAVESEIVVDPPLPTFED